MAAGVVSPGNGRGSDDGLNVLFTEAATVPGSMSTSPEQNSGPVTEPTPTWAQLSNARSFGSPGLGAHASRRST